MTPFKLLFAAKTDPGRKREKNEDSVGADDQINLFLVADGMGGHQAGEVASQIATDVVLQNMRLMISGNDRTLPAGSDKSLSLRANQLLFCARMANQIIFEAAKSRPREKGMGTTLSALMIEDRTATFAHIGDSRIYLFRRGELSQITEDHSLVMEQVRKGMISKEEAASSKFQNVLTRALGVREQVEVDAGEHPVLDGDAFLLCSDGLDKMVKEKDIAKTLSSCPEPIAACDQLIEAANQAGGLDNISVAVVRLQKTGSLDAVKGFFSRLTKS